MGAQLQEYARMRWPDRTRVFGIELKPLTIDHALLLSAIGSPFLNGGKASVAQMAIAIYVLSRPCAEAAAGLRTRRMKWILRLWCWQIGWRCDELDKVLARQTLEAFVGLSFIGPATWDEQDPSTGHEPGSPFLLGLKVALQSRLNCSASEALGYRVREAIWDLASDSEREGKLQLVTDEENAAFERAGLADGLAEEAHAE